MSVFEQLKKRFYKKKVLVVGLGLLGGGEGLVKFFVELGARVRVTDKKSKNLLKKTLENLRGLPIEYTLGTHRLEDFLWADYIFKGPSVPWQLPEIKAAKKRGIPIEMELSFFSSFCPGKIIGITGTRGKSTTTNLIYQILKDQKFSVWLGGRLPNISTINFLKFIKPSDFVVLELSSWDLSGFHQKKISPHIAVFTSFYPDHLNYYQNLNDYFYDKTAIFLYQTKNDFLVINHSVSNNPLALQYFKKLKSQKIDYSKDDLPFSPKYLLGDHNKENAAAAFGVAKIIGLDLIKTKNTIINFSGLPFRQQVVAQKGDILFINDSASTTPIAVIKAIEAQGNKKIFLILGGNSKNLPFADLLPWLAKVKKIILLAGSFTEEIKPVLKKHYPNKITKIFYDLEEAINEAYCLAKKETGEKCVLFSPGATSFAMFNNEFHRGEEFSRAVERVIGKVEGRRWKVEGRD